MNEEKFKTVMDSMFPSEEQMKEIKLKNYNNSSLNPTEFCNWFDNINNEELNEVFYIPESKCIKMNFEFFDFMTEIMIENKATDEGIEEFNNYLVRELDMKTNRKYFIKSGLFSGKFTFKNAIVEDTDKVAEQFADITYDSMMVGCPVSPFIVAREFIETDNDTIYDGMKLNTEFRVFYDFNTNEIIDIVNYWHPEVMLRQYLSEEDYATYSNNKERIVSEFETFKPKLKTLIEENMPSVEGLSGKYSIDFMLIDKEKYGKDFALIDMAVMETSALTEFIGK